MFMAPRIKIDSKFTYLGSDFFPPMHDQDLWNQIATSQMFQKNPLQSK